MAKKKNQSGKQSPKGEEQADLPAPLKLLDADYSAVLRMRNVRWLIVILSVVAALMLGAYLSAVFVPLLVALGIAYILNPLVVKLQKKRGWSRKRAVLKIFLVFIVLAAAIGTWVAISLVRDVRAIAEQAVVIADEIKESQEKWLATLREDFPFGEQIADRINIAAAIDTVTDRLHTPETPEQVLARAAIATARSDLMRTFMLVDIDGDMKLSPGELPESEIERMDADGDGHVSLSEWFERFGAAELQEESRPFASGVKTAAEGGMSAALGGLGKLLSIVLFIALVPLYTWYFMVGFDRVVATGREYLPGRHRERIERILREIDAMMKAFFRGRIVVVAIVAVATTIVFLAFGVKYAVLLGVLSGLGVLIPYFSMIAGWIPALILMWISGDSLGAMIGMSIGFHIINAIESYVLTPKLLGDAVELHPVTIIVGVFVMASLFGLFGALLAVPLTAIAKTLGREFLLPYFREVAQEPRA